MKQNPPPPPKKKKEFPILLAMKRIVGPGLEIMGLNNRKNSENESLLF